MHYRLILLRGLRGFANVRQLARYIHDNTQFSWPTDAPVPYISRLALPWTRHDVGNSPLHGPYFPRFLKIRFYEDRGQVRNDPIRQVARSNLISWLHTGTRISTRATSMYHTVTSSTAPFTIARITRALGSRLGLHLPILIHTEPHYVRIRRLPRQEPDALQQTFHIAQDPYTYLRQLEHFIPGLQHLGPLLLYNGNRFIAYEDLDSADESVVHQIPPGNSILRPRPSMAVLRQPLPLAGRLMDPL